MLIWVKRCGNFSPWWFSLKNSEKVKAVNLSFCCIQQNFTGDIFAKFNIPYSTQSPDIRQKSDKGISNFWISGRSLIKENCHNSRTRNDTDMNIGQANKLENRNKTSKIQTMTSCQQNVTPLSFLQFIARLEKFRKWIPDSSYVKLIFSLK